MSSSSVSVLLRVVLTAMLALVPTTAQDQSPPTTTPAQSSNCPFVTEESQQPFRGCWSETSDVHGYGGVPHSFKGLYECQTSCINNNTCIAIDWDPSNAEKSCWILTSTVTGATLETGFVTHYELNRAFLKCWIDTNGVRGYDRVSHNFTTLDECQTACVNNYTCVAIDYAPGTCSILTSTATTAAEMETEFITHYELQRICLQSPAVSDVWPLFGPEAGGTLLTLTGSELADSQQPLIVFASSNLDHFIILSTNDTQSYSSVVVGKTPTSNVTDKELLIVVQDVDKPPVNTTKLFVYRQNPNVADIFPLSHLFSGGTTVTVTGNNLDAVAEPIITVTVVITGFNSTTDDNNVNASTTSQSTVTSELCAVMNSSLMTCTMPEVRLPSNVQVDNVVDDHRAVAPKGSDDSERARIYVGLIFDGYGDYTNLTAAMPQVKFQFFPQPTFDTLTLIVYRPQSLSDIDIRGQNLQRGSRIQDYRVIIGNSECDTSFLSDNLLTCRPPYYESKLYHSDPFCDDINSVRVYVGNMEHHYTCIRYETEEEIAWIIAVVILLGVPICLLIIVAIIYLCKRCGEEKRATDKEPTPVHRQTHLYYAQCKNPAYSPEYEYATKYEQQAAAAAPTADDNDSLAQDDDSSELQPSYAVPVSGLPPSDNDDANRQPTMMGDDEWTSLYLYILSTAGVDVDRH